jgi:hypothetical protein
MDFLSVYMQKHKYYSEFGGKDDGRNEFAGGQVGK